MKLELDVFQLLWYIEGCARGSHLRQGVWQDFINLYYKRLTQNERDKLYYYVKRDLSYLYEDKNSIAKEDFNRFIACYDKNNRYTIHTKYEGKDETHDVYKYDNRYWTAFNRFIAEEYIVKVEKKFETDEEYDL